VVYELSSLIGRSLQKIPVKKFEEKYTSDLLHKVAEFVLKVKFFTNG